MRPVRRTRGDPHGRARAAPLVVALLAALASDEGPIGREDGPRPRSHPVRTLQVPAIRVTLEEMRRLDTALPGPGSRVIPRLAGPGPRPIPALDLATEAHPWPRPGAAPAPSPAAPPLSLDFPGLGDDGTAIPPDTHGAAGQDHLVSVLNRGFAVFNRASGAIVSGPISLQAFWASLGTGPGMPAEKPFDPRVLFDQSSGRFLVVSSGGAFGPDSWVLLAVSVSSDPTQGFDLYALDADATSPGEWADFPALGVGPGQAYISANMFTVAGCPLDCAFTQAKIWVVEKGSMLAGGPLGVSEFIDASGGFTWQPTHAFGATPVDYIVSEGWSAGGTTRFLRVQEFSSPAGSPVLSDLGFIRVNDYGFDPMDDAPQRGCSATIETNDPRLMNAALRNGRIWSTHHVDNPVQDGVGKTEVAWYEIDPALADGSGSSGPMQQGRVADPARWYYYPSIAVNAEETVALGFSGSGPSDYAGGYYTVRGSADPPGSTHEVSLLQAGTAPYAKDFGTGENRWGDYSATVVDPVDDRTFWTLQEYAADEAAPGCPTPDTGRWGTWWGRFSLRCVGDADGSGRVDGGDLWEWARRFGAVSDPSTPFFLAYSRAVDFDGDGDIDGVDLLPIERDFGKSYCP